jgi:hypothetical protein
MGTQSEETRLADFAFSGSDEITACPEGKIGYEPKPATYLARQHNTCYKTNNIGVVDSIWPVFLPSVLKSLLVKRTFPLRLNIVISMRQICGISDDQRACFSIQI